MTQRRCSLLTVTLDLQLWSTAYMYTLHSKRIYVTHIDYIKVYSPQITDAVVKMLLSLPDNKATGLDCYQSKLLKIRAKSIFPQLNTISQHGPLW